MLVIKNTFQDMSCYFKETPNFGLLPIVFQNKIISFFLEDRHYMVDPIDIKDFLETGSQFTVFVTLKDVILFCKTNKPKGILACRRVWTSIEWFSEWAGKLEGLSNDDTLLFFLMHCVEFSSDITDEWYVISY